MLRIILIALLASKSPDGDFCFFNVRINGEKVDMTAMVRLSPLTGIFVFLTGATFGLVFSAVPV